MFGKVNMLKYVLAILGWLLLLVFGLNISIKLFGADQAVLDYAGSSRNIDTASLAVAIALIFLGLSKILWKFEELGDRIDSLYEE